MRCRLSIFGKHLAALDMSRWSCWIVKRGYMRCLNHCCKLFLLQTIIFNYRFSSFSLFSAVQNAQVWDRFPASFIIHGFFWARVSISRWYFLQNGFRGFSFRGNICTFLVDCLVWSTITHWIKTRFAHSLVLMLSLNLFISAGKKERGAISCFREFIDSPSYCKIPGIFSEIFFVFGFKQILIQCIYPNQNKTDQCQLPTKKGLLDAINCLMILQSHPMRYVPDA